MNKPARKVATLTVLVHDQPNVDVVEMLTAALDRARSGEIIGVALAMAVRGGGESTGFAGWPGTRALLVSAGRRLEYRLLGLDGED